MIWLWVGLLAAYAAFFTLGAVKLQRARRAFEQAWGISPASDDTGGVTFSPVQLAQRDSLVDSLKRLAQTYLDSPEGKALAESLQAGFAKALPSTRVLVLVGIAFLAPAVGMLILTIVWFTRRRAAA